MPAHNVVMARHKCTHKGKGKLLLLAQRPYRQVLAHTKITLSTSDDEY